MHYGIRNVHTIPNGIHCSTYIHVPPILVHAENTDHHPHVENMLNCVLIKSKILTAGVFLLQLVIVVRQLAQILQYSTV